MTELLHWREEAACRRMDPAIFFVDGGHPDARRACAGCPVRQQCLDDAIATGDLFFRGGLTFTGREKHAGRRLRPKGIEEYLGLTVDPELQRAKFNAAKCPTCQQVRRRVGDALVCGKCDQ